MDIEGEMKEKFICNYCNNFIIDPRECIECGNLYCYYCTLNKNCCSSKLVNLTILLKRVYNNLWIKCKICDKKISVDELFKNHIDCIEKDNCKNYEICSNKIDKNFFPYCSKICIKYILLLKDGINEKNFYNLIIKY